MKVKTLFRVRKGSATVVTKNMSMPPSEKHLHTNISPM